MSIRALAGFLLFLAVAGLAGLEPAAAQATQRPFGKVVEDWNQALDRTEQEIGGAELGAPRAAVLKDRLGGIGSEAREIKAKAQTELVPIQNRLKALGPPPEEGAPPEAEEIVTQREKIAEEIAFYEARIKRADLTIAQIAELAKRIAARSLESSIERLSKRYPFPLAPDTLIVAVPDFLRVLGTLGRSPFEW